MAIVYRPMIQNLTLAIDQDVANAVVSVEWDINWSNYDVLTNLAYTERWELAGVDAGGSNTTLYVGPILTNGISANGNTSTHRTKNAVIPWTDLDEDPNSLDEIAAVVTLTPRLPVEHTAQSTQVVVTAP